MQKLDTSPTEIRTPDGWFKVNSDNHFTIGEYYAFGGTRTHEYEYTWTW
jgi:hypothetical protein